MPKYNLTLIIEFDGESGKRESRTYTLPDSPSRVLTYKIKLCYNVKNTFVNIGVNK